MLDQEKVRSDPVGVFEYNDEGECDCRPVEKYECPEYRALERMPQM
jgi:hypothetical protein